MCMQYITWLSGWLLNFTENFSWFFFVCVFLMNIRLLEMAAILDGGWDVTHNLKVCHPKINSAQSFWTGDLNVTFLKTGIQKYIGRKKKNNTEKNPEEMLNYSLSGLMRGGSVCTSVRGPEFQGRGLWISEVHPNPSHRFLVRFCFILGGICNYF